MGTRPPLRQEGTSGSPGVSPGLGSAVEPPPPGYWGPWAHVLLAPPVSFPTGELPKPPEWPEVLGRTDPAGEAAGDAGSTSGGRNGGLLGSARHPVPDK